MNERSVKLYSYNRDTKVLLEGTHEDHWIGNYMIFVEVEDYMKAVRRIAKIKEYLLLIKAGAEFSVDRALAELE